MEKHPFRSVERVYPRLTIKEIVFVCVCVCVFGVCVSLGADWLRESLWLLIGRECTSDPPECLAADSSEFHQSVGPTRVSLWLLIRQNSASDRQSISHVFPATSFLINSLPLASVFPTSNEILDEFSARVFPATSSFLIHLRVTPPTKPSPAH